MPDYALIAAEFVVKPCRDRTSAELYDRVAVALGAAGIRQALPRRTVTGSAVPAVARAAGAAVDPTAAASRYRALRSVIPAWPELTGPAVGRAGRSRAMP